MNSRLSCASRREIAAQYQIGKLSVRKIAALGFQKSAVQRWKDITYNSPDAAFADSPRRKSLQLPKTKRRRAAQRLQTDRKHVVVNTAAAVGVSRATMYRIANEYCDKVKTKKELVLTENTKQRRREFSQSEMGKDHSQHCYADHTIIEVPPMSTQKHCWRMKDAKVKKPVPVRLKFKQRTKMMIYLAASKDGLSEPMFNVRKVQLKYVRRRLGETTRRFRWETFRIGASEVKADLERTVFPWMQKHGLSRLYLDNAPCQDGLLPFITESGYGSPGFASLRRGHKGGFPANSPDMMLLDASVFPAFKREFSRRCPQTIPEAMRVSREILRDLQHVGQKWVAHLDALHAEIIEKDGGASHLLS